MLVKSSAPAGIFMALKILLSIFRSILIAERLNVKNIPDPACRRDLRRQYSFETQKAVDYILNKNTESEQETTEE
jgi:hypothetical protein